MIQISGVIITYNEERNIEACIRSLKGIVDEIVVVDSYSTDHTPEIATKLGAKLYQHPFEGHIEQKNYALGKASYDYILALDADERVSEEMKASILEIKNTHFEAGGYTFNRLNNYCGTWLKHSWYPDTKLRLWDRRKGSWGGTNPHDKVILKDGQSTKLNGDIHHFAYENLEEHIDQTKKFAIIAANAKFKQGKRTIFLIHIVLNPFYKFFRKYVLRLGFLDGYYGFIFSALTAYLNFMKYSRLWELNRNKSKNEI